MSFYTIEYYFDKTDRNKLNCMYYLKIQENVRQQLGQFDKIFNQITTEQDNKNDNQNLFQLCSFKEQIEQQLITPPRHPFSLKSCITENVTDSDINSLVNSQILDEQLDDLLIRHKISFQSVNYDLDI